MKVRDFVLAVATLLLPSSALAATTSDCLRDCDDRYYATAQGCEAEFQELIQYSGYGARITFERCMEAAYQDRLYCYEYQCQGQGM